MFNSRRSIPKTLIILAALFLLAGSALAAPPVVKTVPWVVSNPLIPHDAWAGKTVTLKGTSDVEGANIQYTWDFGDGAPVANGVVSNRYVIEATHVYAGAVGTVFTATLTVRNSTTGETGTGKYYIAMRAKDLGVEVNVAIDEGLWYLHKTQRRTTESAINYGDWIACPASGSCYGGYATLGYYGVTVANINAFEVNGHVESGDPANPYVETVARGMRRLFTWLYAAAIANQTNGLGTFSPDGNANGLGIFVNQSYPYYQGGMFMDAIVASGTPNALATTGPANIVGRTYKSIIQDMADGYSYAQYDSSAGGGWRYNTNEFPDNSACQWAAIGLIPAQKIDVDPNKTWGAVVPAIVKNWNLVWLAYSQAANGSFGYTGPGAVWGPYATTPSGMVQLALDGVGRGSASWDKAETFIRDNFGNGGGAGNAIKDYYYGLFSFVKSMLLHNVGGVPAPITLLRSSTVGVNPIDWYAAEVSMGAPTDGVARTLVNDQSSAGYWWSHNYEGNQYRFETAWAIMMLHRTLFEAGAPVAVAKATPNPGMTGQIITLDGSESFHQDPGKTIDSWQWDCDGDGIYEKSGPLVTCSWGVIGDYPVKLRVTDNGSPEREAITTITAMIRIPPLAPTANAGGPYNLCFGRTPWYLDGSMSVNPDEGQFWPPGPPDTIYGAPTQFAWELTGNNLYDDAFGVKPDVTGFFSPLGVGSYLIQLKVTDTTASSFPASGQPNLFSTDSAQVFVKAATDPACSTACVNNLAGRPKERKVDLTWRHTGAHHYNVYRGTITGGPYIKIGSTTSTYSTYTDGAVVVGNTYYYIVRPALLNETETCQSNEARVLVTAR